MPHQSKIVPFIAVVVAFGAPATSIAKGPEKSSRTPCAFHEHRVTKVTPYRAVPFVGRGNVLKGASLFVPAERGLTAEWLATEFRSHLAATRSKGTSNCPLDIGKIQVRVESGGEGFWVRLIAPNPTTAREVLRRAELLLG